MDEQQFQPGFVKKKIRENSNIRGLVTRARPQGPISPGTEKLHDLLAPHLPAAVRTWVAGLKATKTAWNQQSQKYEDTGFPDHKERRESARAIVEYVVGRAIERSMEITGNYKELTQVLEELKQSPEARRLLPPELWGMLANESGQSTAEDKDPARPHEGET